MNNELYDDDDVYVSCSVVLLCHEPVNNVSKPFWVIGESKMGFLDGIGLEIVSRNSAQMSTRLSETPFAQASNNLPRPVWILAARLSEPRANQERMKTQPSSFASLKRDFRRLSERRPG